MAVKAIVNASRFVKEIRIFIDNDVKRDGLDLLVAVVDTLAENIVPATPVDREDQYKHPGNARGSWHIRTRAGQQLSAPSLDKNGSRTVAAIKGGIRRLDEVENVLFDATEKLVPYMIRLENGWSTQGRGFIQAGINAVAARFPG